MLRLYEEQYSDFNVARETREVHQIEISYTWVYQALTGAGLITKRDDERRTDNGANAGRCRECFFTLTAVSIAGFRTPDSTTCW